MDDQPPLHSPLSLLARRLAQDPDATAFVLDGDQRLSVRGFDALVGRAAIWLQAQGVGEGDTVALWLVNRLDWLVLYFALARRGAALMTVNTRYRGAEVAYLLARSRPKLLVMQPRFRQVDFIGLLAEVPLDSAASLHQVVLVGADAGQALPDTLLDRPVQRLDVAALPAARAELAADGARPEAPSILFTTSGTTSGPKLVVHTQRSAALHVQAVARSMGMHAPGTCLLAALPFAGTFGFVSMLAAFSAAAPVVLHATWDAADALRDLPRHAVTHLFGSDEMFEGLLAEVARSAGTAAATAASATAPAGTNPFPALRLCGFAAFRAGAQAVAERASALGLPMAGLYGSSEVHALFSIQRLQRPLAERLEAGGHLSHPQARLRVRDADTGALLPPGQSGLLEIHSPCNFVGYLNNPEATAQALTDDGFFRTGDIGRLREDGSFVYETRAGDAIRLGGYLVAPAEIEEVVKALPGIGGAQVVALDIGGKARAVAFLVADAAAGAAVPPADAVIAHVKARLAAFKVPARVWVLDAFPVVLSANGTKIQRHKLREMAAQRLAAEG